MHYLHHKLSMIYLYREIFHHITNMHQTVTSSIKCNLTPPQSEILRALRNNKLTSTWAFSKKNSHSNKHKIAWRHYPPILNYLYTASYLFFFHQQMNFESQGISIFLQNSRKKGCLFLSKPFNKISMPCLFIKIVISSLAWGGGLVFFFNLFLLFCLRKYVKYVS